jgi:hypothetical protein
LLDSESGLRSDYCFGCASESRHRRWYQHTPCKGTSPYQPAGGSRQFRIPLLMTGNIDTVWATLRLRILPVLSVSWPMMSFYITSPTRGPRQDRFRLVTIGGGTGKRMPMFLVARQTVPYTVVPLDGEIAVAMRYARNDILNVLPVWCEGS